MKTSRMIQVSIFTFFLTIGAFAQSKNGCLVVSANENVLAGGISGGGKIIEDFLEILPQKHPHILTGTDRFILHLVVEFNFEMGAINLQEAREFTSVVDRAENTCQFWNMLINSLTQI